MKDLPIFADREETLDVKDWKRFFFFRATSLRRNWLFLYRYILIIHIYTIIKNSMCKLDLDKPKKYVYV